jgi:hypothetical protein
VTPLNDDGESRFSLRTTVQMIVDELLIEQWIDTSNYSAFYEQCHPTICTYSYTPTINTALVISTIIALFGGLSISLKLIAPLLIKADRKIRAKCQKNRAVIINDIGSTVDRELIENNLMFMPRGSLEPFYYIVQKMLVKVAL